MASAMAVVMVAAALAMVGSWAVFSFPVPGPNVVVVALTIVGSGAVFPSLSFWPRT